MNFDSEIRAYLTQLAADGARPVHELTVEEARRIQEERAPGLFGPVEEVAEVRDVDVPGPAGSIRIRVYSPTMPLPLPILVYFHGGGWVVGSLNTHDGVCRSLANRTPCLVASVDYRLAPEHRFPAAVEDAWSATTWIAEHMQELGGDPARLAVGGDSAGGNLAAVVALRARRRMAPNLSLQLLIYPVTDHDFETPSYMRNAVGYLLTREAMRWYWDNYVPDVSQRDNPDASPLRATDLSGVAPAVVLTCEYDPLLDEGEAYARRLADAGVPTSCRRHEGLIHGVVRMPKITPRAWELINDSARALRKAYRAGVSQAATPLL